MQHISGSARIEDNDKPPTEVVRIPFHGGEVLAIDVDGKPQIILKPALESIGVDPWTQVEKLRTRSWATTSQCLVVASDGRVREMVTCDVRTFLMLLATIDERRVSESARPLLVAYQSEVADAIEQYWTKGVAVNPRVSHEEAAKVIAVFAQAGVGDVGYWDTKARQLVGRVLGESPEYDQGSKPLTISIYLEGRGVKGAEAKRVRGQLGKALKKRYMEIYGVQPPVIEDLVDRHMVMVAQYQERHRPMFDEVWRSMNRAGGGPSRPRGRHK